MRMKIWDMARFFLATIVTFGICGCVEELDVYQPDSEVLSFTAVLPPMAKSAGLERAMIGEHLYEETCEWGFDCESAPQTKVLPTVQLEGKAGITAYQYSGDWKGTETSMTNLSNAEFTFSGNALTGESEKWSKVSKDKLRVYAYAPRISSMNTGTFTGVQTIPYSVNTDVTRQVDIIAAQKEVTVTDSKGKSIPLTFDHILTAIRFRAGFECTVKSVTINGIYGDGTYTIGSGWSATGSANASYTIAFSSGKAVKTAEMITTDSQTLMLIPQTMTSGAEVSMTYVKDGVEKTLTASLDGRKWESGKMITYTLYELGTQSNIIYFDLAAGNVLIGCTENAGLEPKEATQYSGYIFKNGTPTPVTGTHSDSNIYYVYQTHEGTTTSSIPDYAPVTYDGKPWAKYIENNTSVAGVITGWKAAAEAVNREATSNRIRVYGSNKTVNLTIDDIYSTYADRSVARTKAGIGFNAGENANLIITLVGDSRVGAVHYYGGNNRNNTIVFEGTGSLTVAASSGLTALNYNTSNNCEYHGETASNDTTFFDNHWCSAIGGNDSTEGQSHGIIINSGNIFAGTTKAENCTAIGAGGNDSATITIKGGTVTAVASTTGTAIGGGIGYNSAGGPAKVTIEAGNVYAYNHSNRWDIPSAAIGGAGSRKSNGNKGTINIYGGNVFAQSAVGTAIGGGSSKTYYGGNAEVNIYGGNITAKSVGAFSGEAPDEWIDAGAGIGGGSGCTGGVQANEKVNVNGGNASIKIMGNPVIFTGSIGGGKSGHKTRGNIGTADITVSGGDIQAQFVMAGSVLEDSDNFKSPTFTMTGGTIRNSKTTDPDFYHIVDKGGAVYMEDGEFQMQAGTISDCYAEYGGAVYIKKGAKSDTPPSFKMTGGTISKCSAAHDGGAVYIEDGTVELSGAGAAIEYCSAGLAGDDTGRGGAVCVRKTGSYSPSFTMSDGKIMNNNAVYNGGGLHLEGGEVVLSGGQVSRNIVTNGNGGGISINSGSFSMPEGGSATVNANSAHAHDDSCGKGGGVFVTSTTEAVKVDLLSGSITGNTSARVGGGIGIDLSGASVEAIVTVGYAADPVPTVPDISGNLTLREGGGLYANGPLASITINSGKIKENSTVGYVDNPDVVNVTGKVTLNGGDVKSNNVTYDGNEWTVDSGNASVVQKIVTDTNNDLIYPTPDFRNGYKCIGWNTRKDGLGEYYVKYNGTTAEILTKTVKRSTDLTLYAIWEVN